MPGTGVAVVHEEVEVVERLHLVAHLDEGQVAWTLVVRTNELVDLVHVRPLHRGDTQKRRPSRGTSFASITRATSRMTLSVMLSASVEAVVAICRGGAGRHRGDDLLVGLDAERGSASLDVGDHEHRRRAS